MNAHEISNRHAYIHTHTLEHTKQTHSVRTKKACTNLVQLTKGYDHDVCLSKKQTKTLHMKIYYETNKDNVHKPFINK
jgi:hypothetical protein